jgi:hypothetical protein
LTTSVFELTAMETIDVSSISSSHCVFRKELPFAGYSVVK